MVLYELCSGVRPLKGDSQAAVLAEVLKTEPRPLVFDSNANGGYHVYVISADGGQPRSLTSTADPGNFGAAWSPEGR